MQRAKLQQNRRNSRRLNKTEKSESFLESEEGLQEAFFSIYLEQVSFLLPLCRAIGSEKLYEKNTCYPGGYRLVYLYCIAVAR